MTPVSDHQSNRINHSDSSLTSLSDSDLNSVPDPYDSDQQSHSESIAHDTTSPHVKTQFQIHTIEQQQKDLNSAPADALAYSKEHSNLISTAIKDFDGI